MYHPGMNESWAPALETRDGTLYERIVQALRADIGSGSLIPEGRMPPHRELATRLGIGVGTVTRAYAEAERLGLLTSAVGRGTFVAQAASPPRESPGGESLGSESTIDLSLNLQALDFAVPAIAEGMARLHQRPDLLQHLTVAPHAGIEWHRKTLASWFRKAAQFDGIDWQRLLVTTGAQHALSIVMETFCTPGDVVLTEAATFSGFRTLVEYQHARCVGVAMDREGMLPDALEAAVVATGARLVYLMPTLQNPTSRTMSRARREDIVRVARKHDLTLIEDDVYAPVAFGLGEKRPGLVPLASLAPERTCYVSSVSKPIAMGLRIGVLVAPDAARFELFERTMHATCYATSSVSALLTCQLIKDGAADEIRRAVAQEASHRMTLARRMLGDAIEEPSFGSSLHAWMPMPELAAERIANGALRRGVVLTPPSSYLVDGSLVSGLRLCPNTVSRPQLERALRAVRSALADDLAPGRMSIF
jgi:DNA-binding transcriptional MocR family regulator